MTRQQTEEMIVQHLREIVRIYREYNPGGDYLAMTLHRNSLSLHNEHWDADKRRPINRFVPLNGQDNGGVAL